MEPISKENEFAKINIGNDSLTSVSKSWFLKFGYYWRIFPSEDIQITVPVKSLGKMKIQGSAYFGYVLIALGIFIFSLGAFVGGKDQITGESVGPSSGQVITLSIIGGLIAIPGILFIRSKTSKMKTLFATVSDGNRIVMYASTDVAELKAIREAIKNNNSNKKPIKLLTL